jgi:intracellular multiplication protein IcmK
MLLGWMILSSAPNAVHAQNQTTPPMPAAANPSPQAALNTGTNAVNPATPSADNTTINTTTTTTTNSTATNPDASGMDAIAKTLEKASQTVKSKTKPAQSTTQTTTATTATTDNTNNANITLPGLSNTTPANAPPPLTEEERQKKVFDNALNNVFPLTPEQIQQVMQRMNQAQEAGRAPPDPDPTPVVKIEDVQLDPGVAPPLIKVATGYVTTINILDITGQPWPIQDVVVGGNFQVTGPNDAQVLRLIPQTRFGRGNLSVRLVGLSTPITFRVESGGNEVYYRYDARIPQSGPDAKQSLIDHGFTGQAGDSTLMAVLAGIPPEGAKRLVLSGTDGRTKAWKINDQIYLRTPLTLLSPGWDASVRSADGTTVYVLAESPVLMLSDNGQMVKSGVDIPPDDPFHTNDLKEGKVTIPVAEPAATTAATNTTGGATAPVTPVPGSIVNVPPNSDAAAAINPSAPASQAPVTATPAAATTTTSGSTVTKIGGATIYTNGATPPLQTKTNIPININVGGNGS